MRTSIFYLTDENGDILVDESGNELIAQIQVTDYFTSAHASTLLLHGYKTISEAGGKLVTYNLVDENGNQLVDESGNELIAQVTRTTNLFHAGATRTLVHGG